MPQVKVFRCPSCGASVSTDGEQAQITCQFCGTTIVVPDELRVKRPAPPPQIPFTPQVIVAGPPVVTVGGGSGRAGVLLTVIIVGIVACITIGILASVLMSVGGAAVGLAPAVTAINGLSTVSVLATSLPAASATPGFATLALTFGGAGTGPGKFDDPRAVSVDGEGNVYVGEYAVARVQKFDADGQFITSWMTESAVESAPLRSLAADRAGFVYVVRAGKILKYDGASGKPLAVFDDEEGFDDVVVLPGGGLLACACFGADDLVFMDADGAPSNRITAAITSLTGDTVTNLKMAVDGRGTIFVLSDKDNAVFRFSPDGEYQDRFGSEGDAPGQFRAAGTIAVDSQSRVYVSDFKGIQVFSADGQYLDVFDAPEGYVLGLAFNDQGQLYAASNSNQVYKFVLSSP